MELKLMADSEIEFVTLAETGLTPMSSNAGKLKMLARPATAPLIPAAIPASIRNRKMGSVIYRLANRFA